MAVNNEHYHIEYTANGMAREEFAITFDYVPEISSIEFFVNGQLQENLLRYELIAPVGNANWMLKMKAGYKLAQGDKVLIRRETNITQSLAYILGSLVADSDIVRALDKLTFIAQERTKLGPGQSEIYTMYWGLTAQRNAVAFDGAAQAVEARVTGMSAPKMNFDIMIAPALFRFSLPEANPKVYANAFIAMNKDWDDVLFYEGGIQSKLWQKTPNTVIQNEYSVYYRTRPIGSGQSITVVAQRY